MKYSIHVVTWFLQAVILKMDDTKKVRQLKGHYHDILSCDFSPDSALFATACYDTRVIVWDPYTGDMLLELGYVNRPPFSIIVSFPCTFNHPNFDILAWHPFFIATKTCFKSMKTVSILDRILKSFANAMHKHGMAYSSYLYGIFHYIRKQYFKMFCKFFYSHLYPPPRPIFAGGANEHYVRGVSFSRDGLHLCSVADDG